MTIAHQAPRADRGGEPTAPRRDPARLRAANVRTALVLASIALTFFVGVIASKYMGGAANRQEYLEAAIEWISDDDIKDYMGKHQHDASAERALQVLSGGEWVL